MGKMKIEVLVSTMNQKDYSLVKRMKIRTDAIIVNQCNTDNRIEFNDNGHSILWINSTSRGLSASRNICLQEARGEICLIADDDLEYVDDYEEIVRDSFYTEPTVDIIRFKVEGIEKKFKTYPHKEGYVSAIGSLKISSVEIAFRRLSVRNIRFDEIIGAGTEFCMGEENAFLIHCIKSRLKIYYVPKIISRLHLLESSWKNISKERYLISRGAAFEAMGTPFTHALILQFAIRKRSMFKNTYSLLETISLMEKGRNLYLRKQNKRIN